MTPSNPETTQLNDFPEIFSETRHDLRSHIKSSFSLLEQQKLAGVFGWQRFCKIRKLLEQRYQQSVITQMSCYDVSNAGVVEKERCDKDHA